MSMFEEVFDLVMKLEGGLILHKNPTEEAETYAGIYRVAQPNWIGWTFLDNGETPPINLVKEIYIAQYWDKINLDDGIVKGLIFEYGVNAGMHKAIKTAQSVAGVVQDGILGPKTRTMLNGMDFRVFLTMYSMERVKYYLQLVNKNPRKYGIYLHGWLNRVVESEEWFKVKSV